MIWRKQLSYRVICPLFSGSLESGRPQFFRDEQKNSQGQHGQYDHDLEGHKKGVA
jgi:hypothetical protein